MLSSFRRFALGVLAVWNEEIFEKGTCLALNYEAPRLSFGELRVSQTLICWSETLIRSPPDDSDVLLGNLTVFMPDDNENILSMEKFDGMLTSIECAPQGMTLAFDDDSSFAYAQKVWDWVNGADNHTFLMVTGEDDCGPNTHRLPYLVSSIKYDEERNIARLNATAGSWKDLAHTYELRVGSVPISNDFGLSRRDYSRDLSMDLSANFPFKSKVGKGDVSGEIVCDPCYTAGKMKFEFVIKTKLAIPVGLEFRLAPQGVKARAALKLIVAGAFTSKKDLFRSPIAKIPLGGISIPPDILTLGPVLDIQLGAELGKFEGSISVQTGATAALPDTALLQANLLNPSENKFSSWAPSIDTDDITVEAKVSVALRMFLEAGLKIQAEALGKDIPVPLGYVYRNWKLT
jgi:hypothetical protein